MSRHTYTTTDQDLGRVQVAAGWDRPLQGFFMTVERLDAADDDEGAYAYSNLDDEGLAGTWGFSGDFGYFVGVARSLGIELPAPMVADVIADGAANAGNKCRDWGATS